MEGAVNPSQDSPPPVRSTILGTFLGRGRPRNSSQSHIDVNSIPRELSPSPPAHLPHQHQQLNMNTHGMHSSIHTHGPPSPGPFSSGAGNPAGSRNRRGNGAPQQIQQQPSAAAAPAPGGLSLGHMLRRRRSAGNVALGGPATPVQSVPVPPTPQGQSQQARATTAPIPAAGLPPSASANTNAPGTGGGGHSSTHRIRLVPHLDSRRSLRFDPISRDLKAGEPALRIGRFTDRSGLGLAAVNALSTNKIAFKSKVVSRAHAEVWIEDMGGAKFFIRDTKSSSGTFLNHVRLSPANTESRPHPLKDGDILQLGVDYQGGAEDIYKSVKIRVEIGREWQAGANAFNTTALKNLKSLAIAPSPSAPAAGGPSATSEKPRRKGTSMGIPDCCICLFPVSIRQALFIAPCSHAFHYKCLRPLLEAHHPAFSCPLCRTFADLEEDVEVEAEEDDEFENPEAFPVETPLVPHPVHAIPGLALPDDVMEEGVLADDLEAEDGDEVDELFAVSGGHSRFAGAGAGAETEVEDNAGHARQRSAPMDEDLLPPLPDAEDGDEMDVESGEGSGSAEHGRLSGEGLGGATLQGKRKR